MEAALRCFPALASRLSEAVPCSRPRGAVTVHRRLRQVQRGRFALVGDASGSVDAITGDGLALCFEQALALGEALRVEDLRAYQAAHDRLLRPARAMSRALLTMGCSDLFTTAGMLLLQQIPGLFPALLRLHTGSINGAAGPQGDLAWQSAHT